jgi:UDP-N-acetylmuramate dehydrogenase
VWPCHRRRPRHLGKVSAKHSNYIINRGGASAADVQGLMELTRERVRTHLGVTLEEDIRILGE